MQSGVRVFWHQKVILVYKDFATVGTTNFDNHSFHLDFEIITMVENRLLNH